MLVGLVSNSGYSFDAMNKVSFLNSRGDVQHSHRDSFAYHSVAVK